MTALLILVRSPTGELAHRYYETVLSSHFCPLQQALRETNPSCTDVVAKAVGDSSIKLHVLYLPAGELPTPAIVLLKFPSLFKLTDIRVYPIDGISYDYAVDFVQTFVQRTSRTDILAIHQYWK